MRANRGHGPLLRGDLVLGDDIADGVRSYAVGRIVGADSVRDHLSVHAMPAPDHLPAPTLR